MLLLAAISSALLSSAHPNVAGAPFAAHVAVGPAIGVVAGGMLGAAAGLATYVLAHDQVVDAIYGPESDGDAGTLLIPVTGLGLVSGALVGFVTGFVIETATQDDASTDEVPKNPHG